MGVPIDQLVEGERPAKPQLSGAVTSLKTTLGHQSTVDARNKAFQVRLKCDAIWKNPPHVTQSNFAEINKII